mmetsp:Transcript_94413/g.185151  ORF Transcript_94413/g.185151 Transcript_94413/m.185151 type:complete len:200 (-) Transcript_94413:334-933(-)
MAGTCRCSKTASPKSCCGWGPAPAPAHARAPDGHRVSPASEARHMCPRLAPCRLAPRPAARRSPAPLGECNGRSCRATPRRSPRWRWRARHSAALRSVATHDVTIAPSWHANRNRTRRVQTRQRNRSLARLLHATPTWHGSAGPTLGSLTRLRRCKPPPRPHVARAVQVLAQLQGLQPTVVATAPIDAAASPRAHGRSP